ncbi:MAG TPA: GntR family transcriptional regulator [Actinomycetes bacterium]|nr:GntR family transcriptional regulator [Actinomycetes bacterium]
MPHRFVSSTAIGPTAEHVRRQLLDQLSAGALQPGQRLGGERELAVELGVSRSSLRQALAALEWEGVIRRVPGRGGGTFVSADKVDRDLSRIVGVPALLRDQGFTAGSKVIAASVVAADPATARRLQIEPGAFVFEVIRIRLADGSPISLEQARLSAERFPGLLELPLGGSLYELLDEHYGVQPTEAEERIEVVSATESEAQILDVPIGSPLLSILRTSLDRDGLPVEHSHDLFRADRTRITVRTRGDRGTFAAPSGHGRVVELQARAR